MAITGRRTREPSTALLTGVGLLARMHVHVKFELVRLCKRLTTELTYAWLLFGVRAAHVTIMRRVRGEGFATVTTLEGFLSTVLSDVSP